MDNIKINGVDVEFIDHKGKRYVSLDDILKAFTTMAKPVDSGFKKDTGSSEYMNEFDHNILKALKFNPKDQEDKTQ